MIWHEPYAGTASVALRLLGLDALHSYQGAKRGALGAAILRVAGLHPNAGATALLLSDAGPQGEVWRHCATPAGTAAVVAEIEAWPTRWPGLDPRALWTQLAQTPPAPYPWGPAEVARYLYLQARQAGGQPPIWPAGTTWRSGSTRGRSKSGICQRPVGDWGDGLSPVGLARRLQRLHTAPWPPTAGARLSAWAAFARWHRLARRRKFGVFLDPPYLDGTGYCRPADRAGVLALGRAWARLGAIVLISEACSLAAALGGEAAGWYAVELTAYHRGAGAEWLTLNRPPASPDRELSAWSPIPGPRQGAGPGPLFEPPFSLEVA